MVELHEMCMNTIAVFLSIHKHWKYRAIRVDVLIITEKSKLERLGHQIDLEIDFDVLASTRYKNRLLAPAGFPLKSDVLAHSVLQKS